jgi:hypothetical protein
MGADYKTIQCYTETINWFGHELTEITLTQNKMTICVVVTNKKNQSPQTFPLCIQQQQKYMVY